MREVSERDALVADDATRFAELGMRPREKLVEHTQFVDHFHRRWMDRVAAKVAQKVGVLLEHDDGGAGAREEHAERHSRGPAARNTATGRRGVGGRTGPVGGRW